MNPPGRQNGSWPQAPRSHGGVQHSWSVMQLVPFGKHDGGEATVPHPPSMHVRPVQHAELEAQATPAGEHAGAASGGAYVSGTNVSGAPLSTPGGSTPRGV